MREGDTFRAELQMGMTGLDSLYATMVVKRVTKAGIVYADGTVHDTTRNGRPFRGKVERLGVRFKLNPLVGRLYEFQPYGRHGWFQVADETVDQ